MEYWKANIVAEPLLNIIQRAPGVIQAEIVGSLRREKRNVGDIEILVEAAVINQHDLFGNLVASYPATESINFWELLAYEAAVKVGERYKQYRINTDYGMIKLDLFFCFPPAQWGVLKVIRTGPSEFSRDVVTRVEYGGYLQPGYYVTGGHLEKVGEGVIDTPEEKDFFKYLTIPWVAPQDRR